VAEDAKAFTARLYESGVFDQLLGDTLRPGGLELTARVAEVAGIGQNHTVLDIACGKGTTALFLAREYNCNVIGIDLSSKMISFCRSRADNDGKLADKVSFLLGDAESLPFRDSSFDAVISECSFSLLPNKEVAARSVRRVLKSGGKLVMTDIILRGEVSDELRGQITFACCLAGAWRAEEYISLFKRIGFQSPYLEDYSHELREIAYQLGITFGSIDNFLGGLLAEPRCLKKTGDSGTIIESYYEFLRLGRPGYALLAVTKI